MPLGAFLALVHFPGRTFFVVVINAFMGLPPVLAGLAVFLLLSRIKLLLAQFHIARCGGLCEAKRLLAACSPHLRPLVVFLLHTGARIGEALWLDWRGVDLTRAHVSFPETKNGDPRGVPLHRELVAELANLPHRDGAVFRRPDGEPYNRAGSKIKTAFQGALRRAEVTDFRLHDCRHTWATWHYAAHRDLIALQTLGGWRSLAMVSRYAHANVEAFRDGIEAMPSLYGSDSLTTNSAQPGISKREAHEKQRRRSAEHSSRSTSRKSTNPVGY